MTARRNPSTLISQAMADAMVSASRLPFGERVAIALSHNDAVLVDTQTLREVLRANLFDGSEDGVVTMPVAELLTQVVEIVEQAFGDIYRD